MKVRMDESVFPAEYFRRVDESPDAGFYREPRFVAHIDPETIGSLTQFYSEFVPPGSDVVDLMSSWISHLPDDLELGKVSGLGMNAQELAGNPRLTDFVVHDLNENPQLPYVADSYDRATLAVSIQYLVDPVAVMTSVRKVLRTGGRIAISMSHRCFPTKAIAAFQHLRPEDRMKLVSAYLFESGFVDVAFIDRSPQGADPLWIIVGTAA